MPPQPRPDPTSAAGRQAGDYEAPVLAEPKGGPVPKFQPVSPAPNQTRGLRHLPGKHNQKNHSKGGGGRPRLPGGGSDDSDDDPAGMPATIVSQSLRFARGGNATITRPPGGRSRLTIGGRSVDLTTDREPGDPPTDLEDLRKLITASQYPGEDPRVDGVRRLRTDGGSISIRPVVDGKWVTDTGRVVDSPDDAPRNETYPAEYDLVVNEAGDSFDDNPSTRLSLTELEDDLPGGLESVGRAQRVETGFGPVDVYSPGRGRMGLRVLTDDGPLEVEFDDKDWKALWAAMGDSLEHGDSRTANTAHGPIEVQTDRDFDDIIFGRNSEMFIAPTSGEWSIAGRGEGLRSLFSAMSTNGAAAGITRATGGLLRAAGNQLKQYWLHGEGAGKWATWTQLYNHLKKHMADELAKRVAAQWFHDRYGYWPGHQKGANPTGPG